MKLRLPRKRHMLTSSRLKLRCLLLEELQMTPMRTPFSQRRRRVRAERKARHRKKEMEETISANASRARKAGRDSKLLKKKRRRLRKFPRRLMLKKRRKEKMRR